jgi:hypothetical protein
MGDVETGLQLEELIHSPKRERLNRVNSRDLKLIQEAVKIDHETELQKNNNTWKSCCLTVDKRFVIFISQFSISLSVLGFSLYRLLTVSTCDETQIYIGLISTIIGIYMPQPKLTE